VSDSEFLLLGDALWLDFVNTAAVAPDGAEALPDPAAWLRWSKAVRVDAPAGAAVLDEALRFREQLRGLARALEARRNPPPSVIESINLRLASLEGREQLVRISGAWRFRFAPGRQPSALEAIAQSTAETLTNPLVTVRLCANAECGLYLLDDSPNQSRPWCSRSRCGLRGRIERRRATRRTPLVAEG
jgi:predicted RNA-binding Zn ribbon-like protein